MNESRHRRLESIFLECLELPPEEREAFLDAQCSGDAELRLQVEDLLRRDLVSAEIPGQQVVSPLLAKLSRAGANAEPSPLEIGAYRLEEKIGEGGFGEVYAAEQTTPVRRRVAIKILKAGLDSRTVLARFEGERQALALMDHPAIAKIFDAGETAAGRSYFVMELVRGEPITDFCDARNQDVRARLQLFVSVCRAIEHAHQKGVIHRDLKPSNILVTIIDGEPHPKVIDFGIAKATSPDLASQALRTLQGEVLGTPEYMSPEQATSQGADVDTRSDVYSLGVVLYRLLAGRIPFDSATLRGSGIAEMQRILLEENPPRPSEAAGRNLARELRGDLDWIVLRAMEKLRERRYASAASLAEDIERHLNNEPVSAGPPGAMYRLQKFMRRHRATAAATAAVFLALVAGIAATTTQAIRAKRAEERARLEAGVATSVNGFLSRMLAAANPMNDARGRDVSVREIVDRAAKELEDETPASLEVEAGVRHALASSYIGLGLFEQAEPQLLRAVEIHQGLSPGAPAALESSMSLAETRGLQGRNAEADSILKEMSEEFGSLEDSDPSLQARYCSLQGGVLANLSRYDEADPLLERAVELRRQSADLVALSMSLIELAHIRKLRGRLDEAEPLAREALDVVRRARSGDHHDIAAASARLSSVLQERGNLSEAESLSREAVAMGERVMGTDHPVVVEWMANLSGIYWMQGRLDESEAWLRRSLDTLRDSGQLESVRGSVLQSKLANVLQDRGRIDEALQVRLASLALHRKLQGEVHESVGTEWNNLGSTYRLAKRYEEAKDAFAHAIEILEKVHGAEHSTVLIARHNIGKTLVDQGRAKEAEPLLRDAIILANKIFPAGHPNRSILIATHGRALAALGRTEEARSALREANDGLRATWGADHPRTKEVAGELAKLEPNAAGSAD